jgi:tRNA nucleotidyltransferase (CCA-adding enzyme)
VITDPTGLAIDDIKNRMIKTPLPPRVTLHDDPKRVVRSIYLAAKLGFEVENDIIFWVKNNHNLIKEKVSNGYARNKLSAAAKSDMEKTIKLMNEMELWEVLEIPRELFVNKYKGQI